MEFIGFFTEHAHFFAGVLVGVILGVFATVAFVTYWTWVSEDDDKPLPPPEAKRWPDNGERRAHRPLRNMPTQLGHRDARSLRDPYQR